MSYGGLSWLYEGFLSAVQSVYVSYMDDTHGGSLVRFADCRRLENMEIRTPPPLARDNCINGLMQRLVLRLPWKLRVHNVFETDE